jgi:hypothetical protein
VRAVAFGAADANLVAKAGAGRDWAHCGEEAVSEPQFQRFMGRLGADVVGRPGHFQPMPLKDSAGPLQRWPYSGAPMS